MSATIAIPQPKAVKKQPLTIAEAFQFASVTDLEKDSRRGVEVIIVRVEYKGETHLAEHFVIPQDDADEFVFQMYKEEYYSERCTGRFDVDITINDMYENILEIYNFGKHEAYCYLAEQFQEQKEQEILKNEQSK